MLRLEIFGATRKILSEIFYWWEEKDREDYKDIGEEASWYYILAGN